MDIAPGPTMPHIMAVELVTSLSSITCSLSLLPPSQHGASLKIKALGIGSNVKQYSLYTTAVAALLWEKMQEPMRLKWTKQTKTFIIKYSKSEVECGLMQSN